MAKDKIRSIRILLILLRDNARVRDTDYGTKGRVRPQIPYGLCAEINALCWDEKINESEFDKLKEYVADNIPRWSGDETYGWKPKLWKPRLRWLNKHIKLTKPF